VIFILLDGSYRSIWTSFHEDFPAVTGETALSRIIEFRGLAASAIAGYVFLIRPRGKEGYRVLPAQIIAFGMCMMGAGFATAVIGLGWQFQQNFVAGTGPTGAPVSPPVLPPPQITQQAPPLSLPAPNPAPQSAAEPQPQTAPPLMDGYGLTNAGSRILEEEAFKIKDIHRVFCDPRARATADRLQWRCAEHGRDIEKHDQWHI
jgi:hypothetical protein